MENRPLNKPSPEIEAAGLLAYEQAGAFETVHRRRLPLVYSVLTLLYMAGALTLVKFGHRTAADSCLGMGIFLPLFFWWQWRRQEARYRENLRLLADLERQYGDALSWIQVERHFEALEKLHRELAQEKANEEAGRAR
jgi:hypothetical protein